MTLVIVVSFFSCSAKKYISMLDESNRNTLKRYYKEQVKKINGLYYSRKCDKELFSGLEGYNGEWENIVEKRLDSLINLMVVKNGYDTVYYKEHEHPPLLSYFGVLWKRGGNIYIFSNDNYFKEFESIEYMFDYHEKLIPILQEFDEKKIHSLSHSRPLIHHGSETRIESVNRFIFRNGKCIDVETIFYSEIDMRSNATPTLF